MVIVLDDLGFAQLGCYGSDISTPNLDRLAERGLRFTNFHTTAICSPTRTCLLTGRNHHRVGMGMLPDMPINYPGYTGEFPAGAGTLAQILRAQGYSTNLIGKWHLTPRDQRAAGPFHMWPTGVGFERYYGFLNGETNQWTPNLIRDQSHVEPPATPAEGYHLDKDLADEAIAQLRELRLTNTKRPFLLWYATAAPHAPHQAPPEWLDMYAGAFDKGWDVWRQERLNAQIDLGITPPGTSISERPEWVEAWGDIDADRQRLYARMMEVFAGFVSHADHHIGRVLDHLEESGDLDNTIVVLVSDNGCSAEGGPNGSWNQLRHYISDEPDNIEQELAHYDDLGGFKSSGHFPWGWALAGNTPFRRWKRYTFEGGVRDPFVISWPNGLADSGGVRSQYMHVVDVLPTLLDLAGIAAPTELGGVPQMTMDGIAHRAVLDDAEAPDLRTSQYYECWGSRAIYKDGWKAVTNHVNQLTRQERDHVVGSNDFQTDEWELFDTSTDFTESTNLASTHPEKLAELIELWNSEAERNQVLPLDDSSINRQGVIHLPWMDWRAVHHLRPGDKMHEFPAPMIRFGFRQVAAFSNGLGADASGVIMEQGDWICGWAWFLQDGQATWILNYDGREHRVTGRVPEGTQILAASGAPNGDKPPVNGTFSSPMNIVLTADGEEIARGEIGGIPGTFSPDGAFLTVGYGRHFPVCDDYEPPFPAPSSLVDVVVHVGPPQPLDLDAEMERVMRHQ